MRFLQLSLLTATLMAVSTGIRAADTEHSFNIEAQDLGSALQKLAKQSGVSIFYASDSVAGHKAKALVGRYSINAALTEILSGSGLVFSLTADGSISVKPATSKLNNADPTTLPKVKVVANSVYDAKDPYNEDYVLPNATTGTKTDTPVMETPMNVQVISKQVLKDQQVVTIDQAMRNVSGVLPSPRDQPGGGAIFLRGFQTFSYFRNGFRIDNPTNYSLGLNDRQFSNVESVEVLKGASAILYGRTEPGGMVNIITKQPLDTPYYAASQQFGSYNTYRTNIDSSGPITDNKDWLYRVNMSYQNQGSFRDGVNTENFFIAPIVKWNINPRTQATLEMEYQHDTAAQNIGLVPTLNGQMLNIPYNRNYFGPGGNIQDTFFIGFNWSHQFNDDWSIKHRVQVNKNDLTGNQTQTPGGVMDVNNAPVLPLQSWGYQQSLDTYSSGLDLTGHFNTGLFKHTLLFGGDYYRFENDANIFDQGMLGVSILNPIQPGSLLTPANPTQNNYSQQLKVDNYGLYLQDQIELPYHIHLLGGMRYQYIHQIFNLEQGGITYAQNPINTADAITPRGGILWRPESWLSLYANYTEGFGVNYGKSSDGNAVPPTSAKQYEGGLKTEFFDGRLRTTLAYFDLTKTNIATANANPVLANLGFSSVTGEANSHGPEVDIMGEVLPGWNVIANYTNMSVHVTKSNNGDVGSRFYNVPRNMAKVWSTYEVQEGDLKGVKLGGGVTMQDDMVGGYAGNAQPISGYATVSLMSGYSFNVNKTKITTQLNVDNLLDKHYFTGGANYSTGANAYSPSNSGYAWNYMYFGMPLTLMGSINIQY